MKISFLGLGVMGYPMAGHLQKSGHQVCVYNRTTAKAQQWAKVYGGDYATTPALAVEQADIIFICVGNDNDVREILIGDHGALSTLSSGKVIVDHTTTSASLAQEMYALAKEKQIDFVDAPVSGGQAGAENGMLAVMAGGDQQVFEKVVPLLSVYAQSLQYMGDCGAGQTTKMANQLLIAGVLQGISEGLALANAAGLDLQRVVDAVSGGAAGSWQLNNRAHSIINNEFNHGFAIDWMRKDLGFCLEAAKALNLDLPNARYVDQCYAALQEQGFNRADTSVLVKQYEGLSSQQS